MKRRTHIIIALAAFTLIYLCGYLFPASRTASGSIDIDAPPEAVWKTITDLEGQVSWRSDLEDVRVLGSERGNERWVEYVRNSPPVNFRTTDKIPESRIEIYFSPGYGFSGTGIALLEGTGYGGTTLYVEDTVRAENPLMRMFSYFFYDPGKTMERYMRDLKDHLEQ